MGAVVVGVRIAGAALLVAAVLAWRWHTGAPLRPNYSGPKMAARQVRAAGQCLLTVAVWLALWTPVGVVSWILAALICATVGAGMVGVVRDQRRAIEPAPRKPLPPRQVKVRVDVPEPRQPVGSLTGRSDAR